MNIECDFCKKVFLTKNSLQHHKKTAKYCLEIQGNVMEDYKCLYCKKCLSTNERLITHTAICKERKIKENNQKEEKIKKDLNDQKKYFEDKIKEIESIYQQQIKEKDIYLSSFEEKLKESKEIIQKLETKLEKFEDSVLSKTEKYKEEKEEKDSIPISLKEQMSSIIIEDIKEDETVNYSMITLNNVSITSRPIDHYVNATQLCQAGGKLFKDWFRLESTKELINELSADGGILPSAFVETKRGGNNKTDQGSWIHPDLSIQLAQWISPKFAIQVSKWVRTLFNKGSVEIDLNLLREKERDIRIKDHLIKELKTVCLSKQSRVEYPEKNVIYLLTTEDHLKRRTYIIGKAKNLTNRLGTYNKTCDHTVVYYKECKGEDDMDTAETMILSKLRHYREKANRDRFILPEDKDISLFTGVINECIGFLS